MSQSQSILEEEYVLSEDQVSFYQQNGYISLKGVLGKHEVDLYRKEIEKIQKDLLEKQDSQNRISDYSSYIIQATNVWLLNEKVKQYVFSKRFAQIASRLMKVKGVRLYHDQALLKPPKGEPTPWHQDQYYWPLGTKNTITMWMALRDCPKEMGPMIFGKGTHQLDIVFNKELGKEGNVLYEKYIQEMNIQTESFDLEAGDVTFHSGFTIHSTHPNLTEIERQAMTIIYFEDGTQITPHKNQHQIVDMQVFHPGRKPGEFADTELNPVLYTE